MAGIYIHIPFCKTRCIYCDFFTQTDSSSQYEYVDALCKEAILRKNYIDNDPIESIYFGGGTPSQISPKSIDQIIKTIYSHFSVNKDVEITLEANPDDLDENYLQQLIKIGFNRISIGTQSFDDNELKFLKRRHSAQKAKDAVRISKDVGFENISIDLMYGLPNQSIDIWSKNIDEAISLDIKHISAYHLIYEENTKLYNMLMSHRVKSVGEEISVEMFSLLIDKLSQANLIQYEISNFAKEGYYSRHNSSYWLGKKYLGLGSSAHSYNGENRAWNANSISKYIKDINNNTPNTEIEILDRTIQYNDRILTGMRTMWGLDLSKLEKDFGKDMLTYCLKNVKKHLDLGDVINDDNILKITRKGIFISDTIMSDMMYVK